jgi:hypothetical protein
VGIDFNNDTVAITINQGDNLWDRMKANVTDLAYTEAELLASPELFVWIAQANTPQINNFRNIPSGTTVRVPKHAQLANVVITVKSDTTTYPFKFFEYVEMDRCAT